MKEHDSEAKAINDAQSWYPEPQKGKTDMQIAESPQERLDFIEAQIASHHYGAEHAGLTNGPEWRDHLSKKMPAFGRSKIRKRNPPWLPDKQERLS